tara:strand:+ start:663 stop:1055 length:393 start_codon:yes stop_codon:yes gene_type:complete
MEIFDSSHNLLAKLIDLDNKNQRSVFFTDDSEDFQAAVFNLKVGENIQRHIHNKNIRKVETTSEAIYVIDGKLEVEIYDNSKTFIKKIDVNKGQLILLIQGGHAMNVLEDTKFFEIKQGPYIEKNDKERF